MMDNGYQILLKVLETNFYIEYESGHSYDFYEFGNGSVRANLSVFRHGNDDDSKSYICSSQFPLGHDENMVIKYLKEFRVDLERISSDVREKFESLTNNKGMIQNFELSLALENVINLKIESEIESIKLIDHFNNIVDRVNAKEEREAISLSIGMGSITTVSDRSVKRI